MGRREDMCSEKHLHPPIQIISTPHMHTIQPSITQRNTEANVIPAMGKIAEWEAQTRSTSL